MTIDITYCNAFCGSGKTHAIVTDIVPKLLKDDRNIILAAPTCDVIDEIEKRLRKHNPGQYILSIHSGKASTLVKTNVKLELIRAVTTDKYPGPHVILITHKALLDRPNLNSFSDYDLIIDETFQVSDYYCIGGTISHNSITDHIELTNAGPRYAQLEVTNQTALSKIARDGHKDKALSGFGELASALKHSHQDVYVDSARYQSLVSGKNKNARLVAFSLLRPSAIEDFQSVTMLGATFEYTGLYKLWKNQGVSFRPADNLESRLRFVNHPNTQDITIEYGFQANYSKTFRDQNNDAVFKAMIDHVHDRYKDDEFVWCANKDITDRNLFRNLKAIRLPNYPHGLNSFSGINNIVCLSALNAPQAHVEFLKMHGMSREDVSEDTYHTAIYQNVCRISIRDPENRSPKTIIVPDLRSATWLRQVCFPDAQLKYLGFDSLDGCQKNTAGRPRKHHSTRERVRNHRKKTQESIEQAIASIENIAHNDGSGIACSTEFDQDTQKVCNDILLYSKDVTYEMRFHGTLWSRIMARTPHGIIEDHDTKGFIKIIKRLAKRDIIRKDDSILICPSYFVQKEGVNTSRGIDNVEFANDIWLDFENGTMSHKDFAEIFPTLRIVAFNTYNHTKWQMRWRAYIPISCPITAELYGLFTKEIRATLKRQGYSEKASNDPTYRGISGLDTSKLHAASMFYLPCQAKERESSFFKDYHKDREPLDVMQWVHDCYGNMEQYDWHPEAASGTNEGRELDQAAVDQAISEWRLVGSQPTNGDSGIFRLFRSLKRAGMHGEQLRAVMEQEAMRASSPNDRLRQVKRLFKHPR